MWSRLKATLAPYQVQAPSSKPQEVQHVATPEERITSALASAAANQFGQSLTHLKAIFENNNNIINNNNTDNATNNDPNNINNSNLSQETKAKLGRQLEELNQLVRRKLEEILRGDDHVLVAQACRILSYLQSLQPNPSAENEGLETYLEFLEKIIHKDATDFMKLLVEDSDTTASASVLADLFSLTGSIIHDAMPLVAQFSSDGVHKLVTRSHNQCSQHVTNIFDLFAEELNLADTVQQIQSYDNTPQTEYTSPLITNPLQLDETLQTISLMCAYASRYILFIKGKDASVDCSNLQTCVQVLLGYYLALESFYLEKALSEAITTQQEILVTKANQDIAMQTSLTSGIASSNINTKSPIPPNAVQQLVSASSAHRRTQSSDIGGDVVTSGNTQVDDGFFILKKCLKRGFSTLAVNVACAIVNSASMALEHPYFSSLQAICDKLATQPTDVFLEILNDLELTSDYSVKLHRELTADVDKLFTVAAEKTKLQACLDDMMKSASHTCNKLRKKNLQLYGDRFNAKVETIFLTLFRPITYELDENTYEQAEINDPFMMRFLDSLSEILLTARGALRPLNKSDLALILAAFIASKLEGAVLAKRFSSLGAVQISKEIRLIGDYFVNLGGQPLRYQFTKLAQISQLLNLDRVIDCMEYWIEGKSVFKLNADEIRHVLTRRIDFSPESINMLKLG